MTKKLTKVEDVKMDLSKVIILNNELRGLQTEPTISFAVKYELVKLLERTQAIVKNFNTQKMELFKKFGECTDKEKEIWTLNGAPKEKEGLSELDALIDKEEVFNETFTLEDFKNVASSNPYIQIMKLVR